MFEVSDERFEELINQAMDELPQERIKRLENVAIVFEDEPNDYQREKLKLRSGQTLFGLYEGVPLTRRGNYGMVLPDKITLFKLPIQRYSHSLSQLKAQIKKTLWHEIAHYYGLDHDRISDLEG